LKIELIIGRYLKVDACRLNWYTGTLQENQVDGFGYYEIRNIKGPYVDPDAIACLEQMKFVQVYFHPENSGFLIYNSRLPIVVYVPDGFKVHYRIWKGYKKTGKAQVES
jgi:ecotin